MLLDKKSFSDLIEGCGLHPVSEPGEVIRSLENCIRPVPLLLRMMQAERGCSRKEQHDGDDQNPTFGYPGEGSHTSPGLRLPFVFKCYSKVINSATRHGIVSTSFPLSSL